MGMDNGYKVQALVLELALEVDPARPSLVTSIASFNVIVTTNELSIRARG